MMKYYNPNSIGDVILSGGCEHRNLPNEYTQVEYIESTGTQYIDTRYKPNAKTSINVKYYPAQASTFMCIYGTQDSTGSNRFYGLISSTQFRFQINSNASNPPNFWGLNKNGTFNENKNGTFAETQCVVDLTVDNVNKKVSIKSDEYTGDISFSGTVFGNNLNCTYNMLLLSRSTTGTAGNNFSGRIYGFSIKDNNIPARNFVPARRNSDNVLGMYDTVSNTFFINQGTGTFTAGSDVTTPSPNNPIDIMCNNGVLKVNKNLYSTEYRDKNLNQSDGVTATTNTGVNVSAMINCTQVKSFMVTSANSTGAYRLFKYRPDGTFIDAQRTAPFGQVLEIPSDCGYFRIQYNYSTVTGTENILIYNSAYNLNEIYTDGEVEVVQDSNGHTATAEMLLRVEDYVDIQKVIDGEVTRNVGIKVLDGTENWTQYSQSNNVYTFSDADTMSHPQDVGCLCSHFVTSSGIPSNFGENKLYLHKTAPRVYICFLDIVGNVTAFKQYLASQYANGTPVIMVYPLPTPTTEEVDSQFLDGKTVEQISGSINNLPIDISYLHSLKKCYVTDNSGTLQEVKKIYIGNTNIYNN